MKISVFGLGYVGAVTAACLSRDGHTVIGVDISDSKVKLISEGKSPVVEPGLNELIAKGVMIGNIFATTNAEAAILDSDVSLISVGTPPSVQGGPNLDYVWSVCETIANVVAKNSKDHVVVLRSTVPPNTLADCAKLFENAGVSSKVHLAFNPEFLRESSAIKDYDSPPYTIIGTISPVAEAAVRQMYQAVEAPIIVVEPPVAEMVKYVANTWHATKVSFANEIGRISKSFGVDGRDVMGIIVQDRKLNISPIYMRPGFAYGGSCLPKDLSSLIYYAQNNNIPIPMISSIPIANQTQISSAARDILSLRCRKVSFLGLSFKPGTDDLRESPNVILIKQLIGEGCSIRIYDPCVQEARLMGTNLAYIRSEIPHFEDLLVPTLGDAVDGAELIVVAHSTKEFQDFVASKLENSTVKVYDLAGIYEQSVDNEKYSGIAW